MASGSRYALGPYIPGLEPVKFAAVTVHVDPREYP